LVYEGSDLSAVATVDAEMAPNTLARTRGASSRVEFLFLRSRTGKGVDGEEKNTKRELHDSC
jgi:hypothetical protein